MERKSLQEYAAFGQTLGYIRIGALGHGNYVGDRLIKDAIEEFLASLDDLNLPVSVNASQLLRDLKAELDETYDEEKKQLSSAHKDRLSRLMRTMETVVMAELLEKTALFLREKRYNTDWLFDDIGRVIGEETFLRLPQNAQQDLGEAGRCILLELPTAAVFHIMRACECTLKQLYVSVIKRGRRDPAMWANMVGHLDERKQLDDALKGSLDIYRRGFRNPVAHPDTFHSLDQAQDVLATASQLLNQLVVHPRYDPDAV